MSIAGFKKEPPKATERCWNKKLDSLGLPINIIIIIISLIINFIN